MNMDSNFENPTCSWGAITSLQLKEMKLQETANTEQRLPFIDPSQTHWPPSQIKTSSTDIMVKMHEIPEHFPTTYSLPPIKNQR